MGLHLLFTLNVSGQEVGLTGDSVGSRVGKLLGTMNTVGSAVSGDINNKALGAFDRYGNYCGQGWSNGKWYLNFEKKDICSGRVEVIKVYGGGQESNYRVFVGSNKSGWKELAPAKDDVDVGCLHHDVMYACSSNTGVEKTKGEIAADKRLVRVLEKAKESLFDDPDFEGYHKWNSLKRRHGAFKSLLAATSPGSPMYFSYKLLADNSEKAYGKFEAGLSPEMKKKYESMHEKETFVNLARAAFPLKGGAQTAIIKAEEGIVMINGIGVRIGAETLKRSINKHAIGTEAEEEIPTEEQKNKSNALDCAYTSDNGYGLPALQTGALPANLPGNWVRGKWNNNTAKCE
ncbi:MAG: hypothetical protein Q7R35_10725 [Elusimicrobiota bacterium]|nr:hypothetical protein [Elusimicrobiota bacterium]